MEEIALPEQQEQKPDKDRQRTAEHARLEQAASREKNWERWGTYLPERQWGTVREDYSADGDTWKSFTYDMAQYRAYRWGEDGLLGWTDRECRLCFSTSLWNGKDACLKERLFGLTGEQGNHAEDVKELYYYLDATPTGSYARALYKYPQRAFPYQQLIEENARRGFGDSEYELLDTGVFDEERYFDVQVEYAKRSPDDTLIRLSLSNRGPEDAELTVLPTLTIRNNWSWRDPNRDAQPDPSQEAHPWMRVDEGRKDMLLANQAMIGTFVFSMVKDDSAAGSPILFTENESNSERVLPGAKGGSPYSKDAFHRFVVEGEQAAVNPAQTGTKAAFHLRQTIAAGASVVYRLRLVSESEAGDSPLSIADFEACFAQRQREADEFYSDRLAKTFSDDERNVARQAYAGLLWTRKFYYYIVERWLDGDPALPPPPKERLEGRNHPWAHLYARDVLSLPDSWEYPWFAAWDTAFHVVPMATIDPEYAKAQLLLLLREWYLHPNGQIPAYEFNFSDVNPPVHAWAVAHVYRVIGGQTGKFDTDFLERAFQKLLLNFTWWVNQNDASGHNLFGGGFLGLDNIGVFDRSMTLPDGVELNQADGTSWMGFFCSSMLQIALELAQTRPAYEDIASKFFEHYIAIIEAINDFDGHGLWDEESGFFFDHLAKRDNEPKVLKVRSIVGVVPIFAMAVLRKSQLEKLPGFRQRMNWFLQHRPHLARYVTVAECADPDVNGSHFLELVPKDRLLRLLSRVLDETEFLSDHGVRSLSRYHLEHPFEIDLGGEHLTVRYTPAESDSGLFGGNSNWRGPVWFPINYLVASSLERYHRVYGDAIKVECPTGSGNLMNLLQVSEELERRLTSLFLRDANGRRAAHGKERRYIEDPHWRDLVLFSEYFCGDSGRGCGASHQTGWTALVATCLAKLHGDKVDTL